MQQAILILLSLLGLAGCGASGGADSKIASQIPVVTTPTTGGTTTTTLPSSIPLTYYQASQTRTNVGGTTKSFTAIGSCVIYLSNTYCWDNGMQSVTQSGITLTYNFWGVTYNGSIYSNCYGGCVADVLTAPTLVDTHVTNLMATYALETPSQVLSTGTAHSVTCSLNGTTLNCVDFTIDLSQIAL